MYSPTVQGVVIYCLSMLLVFRATRLCVYSCGDEQER